MMKNIPLTLFLLALAAVHVFAQTPLETEKINYLLTSVEAMEGAKFVRNGTEYDAKRASSHLRLKLKRAGNRVKTADDFIRLCASQSSMTGEPYLIRLPDGATIPLEIFFQKKLKALEGRSP